MAEALQPCPFCLTADERLIELWDVFDAGHIAHIHCEKCGCRGPSVYSDHSADAALTHARRMWNQRQAYRKTPNDQG